MQKTTQQLKEYYKCRPERVGGEGLEVHHQGLGRVGVRVGRLRPVLTSLSKYVQYLQYQQKKRTHKKSAKKNIFLQLNKQKLLFNMKHVMFRNV